MSRNQKRYQLLLTALGLIALFAVVPPAFSQGVTRAIGRILTSFSLGTTSTDGFVVQNITPATVGTTVQISPRLRECGTAWDTAASQTVCFFDEVLPATAATPTGMWKLGYSLNGAAATYPLTIGSAGALTLLGSVGTTGANGQAITTLQTLTELTTIAAAATTDTAIQMPANAVVLAVAVRVTVAIPTATTFTVGDSGSATRFSTAAVSVNLNSTDPGTKAGAYYNAGALAIRITPNGTPGTNVGRVRVVIYYYTVTPPSS